jgi:hypothetical protein
MGQEKKRSARLVGVREDGETIVLATNLSIEAATRAMDLIAGVSVFDQLRVEEEGSGNVLCEWTSPHYRG